MKNLLIAMVLLLTAVSCLPDKKSKDNDPTPDLTGTYQVSRLIDESQSIDINLPASGISAAVIVTSASATELTFRIDVTQNGRVSTGQSATATLRKASGKAYDILDGSTRIGSIDGTDFSVDYIDSGYRFALSARR